MKSLFRGIGLTVLGLGLLGSVGCEGGNEKLGMEDQKGETKVEPGTPGAGDYGKMAPPTKAAGTSQYGKYGSSYGAASKAMR